MNTMQRINKIDMYYNDKTVESTMKSGIKYQYVCGANINCKQEQHILAMKSKRKQQVTIDIEQTGVGGWEKFYPSSVSVTPLCKPHTDTDAADLCGPPQHKPISTRMEIVLSKHILHNITNIHFQPCLSIRGYCNKGLCKCMQKYGI